MENPVHIRELFSKYLTGDISPAELNALLDYFGAMEDAAALREMVRDALTTERESPSVSEAEIADTVDAVQARLRKRFVEKHPRRLPVVLSYAAAIVLLVSVGFAIYWFTQSSGLQTQELISQYGEDVLPGGDRATLVLDNGDSLSLLNGHSGIIVGEDGVAYEDGTSIPEAKSGQYATLAVPRGGRYHITLPDGTQVWLNSASSLTYPTVFDDSSRTVSLRGEGFFEVVPDKLPFKVKTTGQTVMVLGTRFNVNAYQNEPGVTTTLVSGSVEIALNRGRVSRLQLKPGEQAIVSDKTIKVRKVALPIYTAWKDGDFRFRETPLPEVLRQLERWYDIEVDYHNVPNDKIHGIISRDKKLSSILFTIEKVSGYTFRFKEGRLSLE